MTTRCGLGKVDIRAITAWIDVSTGECLAPCQDGSICGARLQDHPEIANS